MHSVSFQGRVRKAKTEHLQINTQTDVQSL